MPNSFVVCSRNYDYGRRDASCSRVAGIKRRRRWESIARLRNSSSHFSQMDRWMTQIEAFNMLLLTVVALIIHSYRRDSRNFGRMLLIRHRASIGDHQSFTAILRTSRARGRTTKPLKCLPSRSRSESAMSSIYTTLTRTASDDLRD